MQKRIAFRIRHAYNPRSLKMTRQVTVTIEDAVVERAKARAAALKGKGARRRYNLSCYIEELLDLDTESKILESYDKLEKEGAGGGN